MELTPETSARTAIECLNMLEGDKSLHEAIHFFLPLGKDDDMRSRWLLGETFFHYLAKIGNFNALQYFLEKDIDPDIRNQKAQELLREAARGNYAQVIRFLLSSGPNPNLNPNLKNSKGCAPLHMAAILNSVDAINALLEGGADPNIVDNHGRTPLHLGTILRNTGTIHALLKGGANPNIVDKDGHTPSDKANWDNKKDIFFWRWAALECLE